MHTMLSTPFCCPVCKETLSSTPTAFRCESCARSFQVVDGIPDFFLSESGHDFNTDPNITWLEPHIVEARETIYRLCTRELAGMAFCVREIGRQTKKGCRVLEVGMGTGHFTRWLAEVSEPGTEIYAFDCSWPIIEKAKINAGEMRGVTLFRANAREALPFKQNIFDVVFTRLAPLGPRGVPNVQTGFGLLKPGGWYVDAGWEPGRYETSPTEWAIQHGYTQADYHEWQYFRVQSEEESTAWQIEQAHLSVLKEGGKTAGEHALCHETKSRQGRSTNLLEMTYEHVLIAQKPE